MFDKINKPRKTYYSDIEFRDLIRTVSNNNSRIYFTDVDFVAYAYDNRTRVYKIILEAKRDYQIKNGIYKLQDSDKAVIGLSKILEIPFIFAFYKEGNLRDEDKLTLIWLKDEADVINIEDLTRKNCTKILTVEKFKEFLRRLLREEFEIVWTSV